jgi:hypothetical protein
MPKGLSKAVNFRRTGNTMVKRKGAKGQTMMNKAIHKTLKIQQQEPH